MKIIDFVKNNTYNIDCRIGLKQLPLESIDCFITSPPYYGIRNFGLDPLIWDDDKNCDHEWSEYKIDHKYTGGVNKNFVGTFDSKKTHFKSKSRFCCKCGAWEGSLGQEPSIKMFVNHLCDIYDEVRRVMKSSGTCWVNLKDKISDKCCLLVPERFAIEMCNRGWILRNTVIWYKPNAAPESAKDRFTTDYEVVYFFVKSKKYYFDREIIKEEISQSEVNLERRKYKPGDGTKGLYAENKNVFSINQVKNTYWSDGKYKRCVWKINTKPSPVKHFATFPEELVEPMILAGCPEGGIVCDIFGGIGTTAMVSIEHERDWIMFELNKEYFETGKKLIQQKIYDEEAKKAKGQGDFLMI